MKSVIDRLVNHFGSQVKTAKSLGVSQSAVSQWVSGSCRMSPITAIRAEKITGGLFKAEELCHALEGTKTAA